MGVAERREREREERRHRILDAAEGIFFDSEGGDATMDDIAAAAELSKGTLYLYFKSKDELFQAIAQRCLSKMVERIEALRENAGDVPGRELLARIGRHNREFGLEHPQHLRAMLMWLASGFRAQPDSPGYDEYLALVSRLLSALIAVVDQGKGDGSIRSDVESLEVVMHLWGGTMGMWLLYLARDEVSKRTPRHYDFDRLLPSFAQAYLKSISTEGDS